MINMWKAFLEFVRRGCLNAQSARPIAAIDAVVACRDISRSSKVVAPVLRGRFLVASRREVSLMVKRGVVAEMAALEVLT